MEDYGSIYCDLLWFLVISCDLLWFLVIYCDLSWFSMISWELMSLVVSTCEFWQSKHHQPKELSLVCLNKSENGKKTSLIVMLVINHQIQWGGTISSDKPTWMLKVGPSILVAPKNDAKTGWIHLERDTSDFWLYI